MTVSSETSRKTFAGDGSTTSFDTSPMVFFDDTDLTVYVVTTATGVVVATLVLNTDYTVSGGDGSTGTLDLSAGSDPYGAPASGTTLVIVREVPATQASDFVNNDGSDAEVLEDALDRLTMIAQQHATTLGRSFTLSDSDVSGASTTIPTPEASQLIGWNSDGDELVNYSAEDLDIALTTAFTLTLLDDADAGEALTTLGVSAFAQTLLDDADADAVFQTMVDGATAETAPAGNDLVLISDVSLTPDDGRKMTLVNLLMGWSAESAPAVDDTFALLDTSAGANGMRKMTFENLFKVVNAFTEDLAPVKANDFVMTYDASAAAAKKVQLEELPLPRSYLAGGTLSNGTDATNDIDVAAGEARDSTNTVNIRWSALSGKQLDAAWAAGSSAGMRDTGAIANGTWHIYAIRKDSDASGDILASTSASAPTMPSGYTYFRRIGSILRESAAIVAFSQFGDEFLRSTAAGDVSASNPGDSAVSRTLSVPTGLKVRAIVSATHRNTGGAGAWLGLLSPLDVTDTAVSLNDNNFGTSQTDERFHFTLFIRTNTSAQIRSRLVNSNASSILIVRTLGWIDTRGRDE